MVFLPCANFFFAPNQKQTSFSSQAKEQAIFSPLPYTDPIKRRISISRRVRLHAGQIKGSSVINAGPIYTPGNAGPVYQYTPGKDKVQPCV